MLLLEPHLAVQTSTFKLTSPQLTKKYIAFSGLDRSL